MFDRTRAHVLRE